MTLHITFDSTFFMSHYFSNDETILRRTKEILRRSRLQGNLGVIPTVVLEEFYAQAAKRIGADEAERRFKEILDSDLVVVDLTTRISKRAGVLRHMYEEKIPWINCLIAATGIESGTQYVITEDPEFKSFREIKCRTIQNLTI